MKEHSHFESCGWVWESTLLLFCVILKCKLRGNMRVNGKNVWVLFGDSPGENSEWKFGSWDIHAFVHRKIFFCLLLCFKPLVFYNRILCMWFPDSLPWVSTKQLVDSCLRHACQRPNFLLKIFLAFYETCSKMRMCALCLCLWGKVSQAEIFELLDVSEKSLIPATSHIVRVILLSNAATISSLDL